MTPKLPELLITELLTDPSRSVRSRERAVDSVAFSNVLDAAKDTAAKGTAGKDDQLAASAQSETRSETRANARAQYHRLPIERKAEA